MKADIKTVEVLTDIVARQARLIAALHGVIVQLNAVTSLDDEAAELKRLADEYIGPVD